MVFRRRNGLVQTVPSQHPGLRRNEACPIGKGGDRAQVLADVLLAHKAHRNGSPIGIDDGRTEQRFEHEYTLGMVPQRAMPGIRQDRL